MDAGLQPGADTEADLPRVVLAGRPNAGKSTLFNRLLRRRKALVFESSASSARSFSSW